MSMIPAWIANKLLNNHENNRQVAKTSRHVLEINFVNPKSTVLTWPPALVLLDPNFMFLAMRRGILDLCLMFMLSLSWLASCILNGRCLDGGSYTMWNKWILFHRLISWSS